MGLAVGATPERCQVSRYNKSCRGEALCERYSCGVSAGYVAAPAVSIKVRRTKGQCVQSSPVDRSPDEVSWRCGKRASAIRRSLLYDALRQGSGDVIWKRMQGRLLEAGSVHAMF